MRFLGLSFKNIASFYQRRKDKVANVFESVNHKQLVLGNVAKVWIQHTNSLSFNINISFALI